MTTQPTSLDRFDLPAATIDHDRASDAPVLFAVDDDPATLALVREIAHDAGWTVHGFTRLADLRNRLDRQTPTLLILDDDLPDGRGGDLARDLREDPRMAAVPLLVCTAAHPMRRADITRWAPVIPKPFEVPQIEAFLAAAASRRQCDRAYDQAG